VGSLSGGGGGPCLCRAYGAMCWEMYCAEKSTKVERRRDRNGTSSSSGRVAPLLTAACKKKKFANSFFKSELFF
jgi:hypothetical protein